MGRFLGEALSALAREISRTARKCGSNSAVRNASYGLGWFLGSYRRQKVVTHGGAIAGFSSEVNRFDGFSIVVLSNGKQGADRRGQADAIADALYDRLPARK